VCQLRRGLLLEAAAHLRPVEDPDRPELLRAATSEVAEDVLWEGWPAVSAVPLYIHIPVVLGLLTLHGSTVYWALKRIRALEGALNVKDDLLDAGDGSWAFISPGGTMVLTLEQPTRRVRITALHGARLRVETE
jgi:hypothetical protein